MEKILEGIAIGKRYQVYELTGKVVNMSTHQKVETTTVQSYTYGDQTQAHTVRPSTSTQTTTTDYQYIDLELPNGEETKITLVNFYVPCRWQDRMTFWGLDRKFFPFVSFNHNSGEFRTNKGGLGQFLMSWFLFGALILMLWNGWFVDSRSSGDPILWAVIEAFTFAVVGIIVVWLPARVVGSMRASSIRARLREYLANEFKPLQSDGRRAHQARSQGLGEVEAEEGEQEAEGSMKVCYSGPRRRRRGGSWGVIGELVQLVAMFRFLVWIGVLAGLVWMVGVPELRADYTARGSIYTRCDYLGPVGWAPVFPEAGSCPLIRFRPAGEVLWKMRRAYSI